MTRIGVIGIGGAWSTERLLDAIERKTGFRCLVDMSRVRLDLPSGEMQHDDVDLLSLDALVIKKIGAIYSTDLLDRLDMLRMLASRGLRIFSNPSEIMRVLNRLTCTITLQSCGIPMPPTIITESVVHAMSGIQEFGDAILKPLFSTKARGMQMVSADSVTMSELAAFQKQNTVMYIQKRVDIPGKDLGVVFLGGQYLTTYARVKTHKDTWTTSTAFGGRYEPHEPSAAVVALAQKSQDAFNLDFTCVDIVETGEGPMVFEVSAFGGFRGIAETCNIDAAERYAAYVLKQIGN